MKSENRQLLLTPAGAGAIAVIRLIGPGVGDFLRNHFSRPVLGRDRSPSGPSDVVGRDRSPSGPSHALSPAESVAGHPDGTSQESRKTHLDAGIPWHGRLAHAVGTPTHPPSRDEASPSAGEDTGGSIPRCVHGDLRDGETVIDDVVVVATESLADISTHGGPWVVHCVVDLAARSGFASSTDPLDGVDGDTLIEKEIAAALPLARTELAIDALLAQRDAWSHLTPADYPRMLTDQSLLHLLHPPRVAIIGVPNVGKSTLANQLFAQERSITADLPGTTRDWVGELANIDGLPVVLVDTPGLRPTDDPTEQLAIQRSRPVIAAAALIILVLDPTQPRAAQDRLAAEYPAALCILNKSDRPPLWRCDDVPTGGCPTPSWHGLPARAPRYSAASTPPLPPGEGRGESLPLPEPLPPETTPLRIVATTGHGVDQLRHAIQRHFQCEMYNPNLPRCWTDRQWSEIHAQAAV